ncbi:MAG TPA: gliding motility protein GldN [Pelobium sp.]
MKNFIFGLLLISYFPVSAQVAGAKKPVEPIYSIFQKSEENKIKREDSLVKAPLNCASPLPRVKSDDVIFAKKITRDIYFVDPANRYLVPAYMDRNIIDILLKGVRNDSIAAYQVYDGSLNKFDQPITNNAISNIDTIIYNKIGLFAPKMYGDTAVLKNMALRLVEDWYFDTNRSEFKSFIISIGLMYSGKKDIESRPPADRSLASKGSRLTAVGSDMGSLFYVNYPTIRNYLCKFRIYSQNEKIRYSFDDVFQLRYFSSLIIKESNVGDVAIGEMKANNADLSGIDKLLEADRIKKSLVQYEQDMWEH